MRLILDIYVCRASLNRPQDGLRAVRAVPNSESSPLQPAISFFGMDKAVDRIRKVGEGV